MPAAAHRAIIPTVIGEQVNLLCTGVQKPFLERPACLSLRHVPVSLVPFLPFESFVLGDRIKVSGNELALRKEYFGVDIERLGDAFEKVEGGRELGVLDLAHMAAAHFGPMSKLLLAEAAGASQFLVRREIAGMGCLPIRRSRDDPSRKHTGSFNRSFGKGRHRQYRCRQSVVHREVGEDEFYEEIWGWPKIA